MGSDHYDGECDSSTKLWRASSSHSDCIYVLRESLFRPYRDYEENMASTAWRTRLNDSAIFAKMKESKQKLQASTDSKNILSVKNGFLFVWNAQEQSVLTVNLIDVEHKDDASYQTLVLSNPPVFEVTSLLFNWTGTMLALSGLHGVCVMELPRQWGKDWKFDEGKEKILCKTFPIGERYYIYRPKCEILQVSWHPGSKSHCHLVVLDSENQLRIFDASSSQLPPAIYPLGSGPSLSLLSSKPSFHKCLGDTAVAFDFGPPLQFEAHNPLRLESAMAKTAAGGNDADAGTEAAKDPSLVWPVFILRGNGDVYILYVSLETPDATGTSSNLNSITTYRRSLQGRIRGPLTMHPPAEDNYGVDACSILCLQTTPSILVIATSSGTLYHCLVLHKGDEEDGQSPSQNSENSWLQGEDPPELALYVYESVELELSLTTLSLETGDIEEDNYTCPIRLISDPTCSRRYHCCHAAGVHTVALPIVTQLEEFAERDGDEMLLSLIQDQECIVEHLICTKPLNNSPSSPVLGITIFPSHKSQAWLISLTSDFEAVVLHLAPFHPTKVEHLPENENDVCMSPLHTQITETFDSHIRKELQRTITNPLLKSSATADLSPQDGLQLLVRASQILKEEYIHRLERVHGNIQNRVKQLQQLKNHQLEELKNAETKKELLSTQAQELAERYEDAFDKQAQLNARVEQVILKIQKSLPLLSNAEQQMKKELETVQEHLKQLENSLEQIKVKRKVKENYVKQNSHDLLKQQKEGKIELNDTRKKQLHEVLKKQGEEITELVRRINSLKQDLDL